MSSFAFGSLKTLRASSRGASMVQYIILVGVVALVAVAGYRVFGRGSAATVSLLGERVTTLTSTTPGGGGGGGAPASAGPGSGGGGGDAPPADADDGLVCTVSKCKPGSGQCFVAGTIVLTEDGPRAIESIVPGDKVASRDEHTGLDSIQSVTRTFVRSAADLVRVHMRGVDGREVVVDSTSGHPYWTMESTWKRADALSVDELLYDAHRALVRVLDVERLPDPALVYNLEVETTHTYFVGDDAVWVHNTAAQDQATAAQIHNAIYGNTQAGQYATIVVATLQTPNGPVQVAAINTGAGTAGYNALVQQAAMMGIAVAPTGLGFGGRNNHAEENLRLWMQQHPGYAPLSVGVNRPVCDGSAGAACYSALFPFPHVSTPVRYRPQQSQGWNSHDAPYVPPDETPPTSPPDTPEFGNVPLPGPSTYAPTPYGSSPNASGSGSGSGSAPRPPWQGFGDKYPGMKGYRIPKKSQQPPVIPNGGGGIGVGGPSGSGGGFGFAPPQPPPFYPPPPMHFLPVAPPPYVPAPAVVNGGGNMGYTHAGPQGTTVDNGNGTGTYYQPGWPLPHGC